MYAGNLSIFNSPGIITHCPPGAVDKNLHIANVQILSVVGGLVSIDQSDGVAHLVEGLWGGREEGEGRGEEEGEGRGEEEGEGRGRGGGGEGGREKEVPRAI